MSADKFTLDSTEIEYIYDLLHDDIKARELMVEMSPEGDQRREALAGIQQSARLITKLEILIDDDD
jgi:hypothetical protein